jgi:hypothetical protein
VNQEHDYFLKDLKVTLFLLKYECTHPYTSSGVYHQGQRLPSSQPNHISFSLRLKVQSLVSSVVSQPVQIYGLNMYTSDHFLTVKLFAFMRLIISNKEMLSIIHIHNPLYHPERSSSLIEVESAVHH